MGSTDLMLKTVKRAEAAWNQEYLGMVDLERKLSRKILEDPGPGPPSPPPSSGEASSLASRAKSEDLLANAGELADRQHKLDKACAHLQAEVAAAGGGPWEGRLDLTQEAMNEWMGDQDDRIYELKERVARKQRDLVGWRKWMRKRRLHPEVGGQPRPSPHPRKPGTRASGAPTIRPLQTGRSGESSRGPRGGSRDKHWSRGR